MHLFVGGKDCIYPCTIISIHFRRDIGHKSNKVMEYQNRMIDFSRV